MGEYTRAISSPVVLPPPSSAPLPQKDDDDVSAPSPPQFCHGGCGRAARIQSRFRLSYCCDSCEDDGSHDEECGLSVHQLKNRRFTEIAGSPTDQHAADDSITDADSITDESPHTLTPPPVPHSGKYEVRQIQTRVWTANVVADTAEEAKRKAWSSSRGWTSESDNVVLEAAADTANDQHTCKYTHKWNKHLSAAAIATNRHLSDTEQGITAAFPEVTGDGAMQTSLLEVDSSTLVKIGPRYSFATPAEAALIRSGAVTTGADSHVCSRTQ